MSAEDRLDPTQAAADSGATPHEPASATLGTDAGVESTGATVQNQAPGATTYSANQIRRARELLTRLYAARRTARFYPMDHPATEDGVDRLAEAVAQYHAEGVDVSLAFFEGELIMGEQLLTEESILFDQLIRELTSIGAGSIIFRRGLSRAELVRAIQLLSSDSLTVKQHGGMPRMIAEAGLSTVEIGAVRVYEKPELAELDEDSAKDSYSGALDLVREIDSLIRRNKMVNAGRVKTTVRSLVDNVLANRYAMLELAFLKNYDEYTFYHSANVALLSLALGSMITHDYRFLSSLGTGALLHDIGKMTVDLEILNKPGALSAEEWALVRQHPVRGAEQAAAIPGLDRSAIVIILEHHMRYDLSGYPHGPLSRGQHLASRIVAVADSYDAMTSQRSYSAARVQDEAMSILARSAGNGLDPALVRLFISMLGIYPPRSVVRLTDGATGIVLRRSEASALSPVVRIIADKDGTMVAPYDIDLSAEETLKVDRSLDTAGLNVDVDEFV